MADQKPTKKDFVNLINTVMGQEVMTENQLTDFLDNAKKINDSKGTEGLLEYVKQVTNAPASKDQLRELANRIKKTGNPIEALDFLKSEKLLSEQQTRKLNQAIEQTKKKKRKR